MKIPVNMGNCQIPVIEELALTIGFHDDAGTLGAAELAEPAPETTVAPKVGAAVAGALVDTPPKSGLLVEAAPPKVEVDVGVLEPAPPKVKVPDPAPPGYGKDIVIVTTLKELMPVEFFFFFFFFLLK